MGERNWRPIDFWIDTEQPPRRKRVHYEIGSQRIRARRGDDGSSALLLRPVYDLSQLRSTSNSPMLACNNNNNNQPLNRNGPNRSELRRNADRFRATANDLAGGSGPVLQPPTASSLPSPGYWNQYGGQESGVNTPSTEYFVFYCGQSLVTINHKRGPLLAVSL